ncbi:ATP-dependent DNA helicase RecG [Lachnospiraceae bacterium PF1-21]
MKENKSLELKAEINRTYLKTVSAFANYQSGSIFFGVADDGAIVGVMDAQESKLNIENAINDSINPQPVYNLTTRIIEGKEVVELHVEKGYHTPYLYKNKAYRRADTSTIEVDSLEFKRLVLAGSNINYEELPSNKQDLTFLYLGKKLKEVVAIDELNKDILKTLDLYTDREGYNLAANLLSDNGSLRSSGVDIARFGKDINTIEFRKTIADCSILEQYDVGVALYKQYYQYEKIEGMERNLKERIPSEAFREALANALVHREWDVNGYVQIAMYNDRIEIISPGGLPSGVTEEDYLQSKFSILRNPIIGNVFFRLRLIEQFGTGIARIKQAYEDGLQQPRFKFTEGSISVVLPVSEDTGVVLDEDDKLILRYIREGNGVDRLTLEQISGFKKSKVIRIVNNLIERGLIEKVGRGPATFYK